MWPKLTGNLKEKLCTFVEIRRKSQEKGCPVYNKHLPLYPPASPAPPAVLHLLPGYTPSLFPQPRLWNPD